MNLTRADINRFWSKVAEAGPAECWQWTTQRGKCAGYGTFVARDMSMRPSRVAYALTHGPIPDGLFVLHNCDNPSCVNPRHLFLGTQKDNVEDMMSKGRGRDNQGRPMVHRMNLRRSPRGRRVEQEEIV